ncbi:MAG: hypothetical protein IGS49_08700 [Chlorogloeopsis fritschii C42_A2020_084]|nr:hypothetical protein [Chlorogloeopsis fritschii]MBF2005532.1 hypothetical protein [Chlorogloeopsis fritschii C42_A2020_084]
MKKRLLSSFLACLNNLCDRYPVDFITESDRAWQLTFKANLDKPKFH